MTPEYLYVFCEHGYQLAGGSWAQLQGFPSSFNDIIYVPDLSLYFVSGEFDMICPILFKIYRLLGMNGQTFTSQDGINFTPAAPIYDPATTSEVMEFASVAYGGNRWMAVGQFDGDDFSNIVYASQN